MQPTNQPTDLGTLKQNAYNAAGNVSSLTMDAPSMLQSLKQNLVGIFSKDNPVINARNDALSGYLSSPDVTRADLLPSNLGDVPGIAGRPLTLSPTQQNAIVASRSAAALAPLAGYNEILKGMYGNISDLVGNAGDIYKSTIAGAQSNASNLMDLYKTAVAEIQARNSAPINALNDPMIMALLSKFLNPDTKNLSTTGQPSLDDIFAGGGSQQQKPQQNNIPLPAGFNPGVSGASASLAAPQQQSSNSNFDPSLWATPTPAKPGGLYPGLKLAF